jgi:tRNA dimethylallyltransferase
MTIKMNKSNKIIVILGPTSSGKSDVAIRLAKKFNGEIISADSRQVYRGLDIGAGKEPGVWDAKNKFYISSNIPHYGIDIISPNTEYNAAKFKKYADKVITDILSRGKVPIICGGTGFWIKAIVDNIAYPEVKPNPALRNQLRNKKKEALFKMLQKLDPARAKTIDRNNPARLIRAIEICKTLGKVPRPMRNYETDTNLRTKHRFIDFLDSNRYKFLQIGISLSKDKLQKNIKKRLQKRFAGGMISEVKKLHFEDKVSWKRLESFGLGYSLISRYLKFAASVAAKPLKNKQKKELFEKVYLSEKDYAKRQMTWFQKDKRIVWQEKYSEIEKVVSGFIMN